LDKPIYVIMKKKLEVSQGVVKTLEAQRKHIMDKQFNTDMLFGKQRHWCPCHGNIAIDDTMIEFESCDCNLEGFA